MLAKPSKCLKIVRTVSTKQKLRLKQFSTTFALLGAGLSVDEAEHWFALDLCGERAA